MKVLLISIAAAVCVLLLGSAFWLYGYHNQRVFDHPAVPVDVVSGTQTSTSAVSSTTPEVGNPANWQTFYDSADLFAIKYPNLGKLVVHPLDHGVSLIFQGHPIQSGLRPKLPRQQHTSN